MKKRVLSLVLVLALVICLIPAMAFAEDVDLVANKLKDEHCGYAGNDAKGLEDFTLTFLGGVTNVDKNDPAADFSFWHFIDSSCTASYAEVTFEAPDGARTTATIYPVKNSQHYAVITPSGWKLAGGCSYAGAAGQFNLSHSFRHEPAVATVIASAKVDQFYMEYTNHQDWVHTEQDVYTQIYHENYERDVYRIMKKVEQDRYVPTFEKKVNERNGTLVTRLTYNAKSQPTNGGAFKNGHTYVKINVAEAANGLTFTIADSSKNTGKKTANQFNRPIGYTYNVKVADGKLTVSFDDRLVAASVGAYVVSDPSRFPGNAPAHHANEVTVNLPANNGYVYLYTHIEALKWYPEVTEWVFAGWQYMDTVYSDEYFADGIEYGEYELVSTDWDEKVYVETLTTDTCEREYQTERKVDVPYEGSLKLTVNGEEKALDTAFTLEPGTYEFALSGEGFETVTKSVTVAAGEKVAVQFGTIEIRLADVTLEETVKHVENVKLDDIVNPVEGEAYYSDRETVEKKVDDSFIKGEDIFCGDMNDPFCDEAIRIGE